MASIGRAIGFDRSRHRLRSAPVMASFCAGDGFDRSREWLRSVVEVASIGGKRPPGAFLPLGVRELAPALLRGACSAGRRPGGLCDVPPSRSKLRGPKREQAPALQGGVGDMCRSVSEPWSGWLRSAPVLASIGGANGFDPREPWVCSGIGMASIRDGIRRFVGNAATGDLSGPVHGGCSRDG
jgi:hypothetical protein